MHKVMLGGRKWSKVSMAIPLSSSHLYFDLLSLKRNPLKVNCNNPGVARRRRIWSFISAKCLFLTVSWRRALRKHSFSIHIFLQTGSLLLQYLHRSADGTDRQVIIWFVILYYHSRLLQRTSIINVTCPKKIVRQIIQQIAHFLENNFFWIKSKQGYLIYFIATPSFEHNLC